jgi:hypothetical protein
MGIAACAFGLELEELEAVRELLPYVRLRMKRGAVIRTGKGRSSDNEATLVELAALRTCEPIDVSRSVSRDDRVAPGPQHALELTHPRPFTARAAGPASPAAARTSPITFGTEPREILTCDKQAEVAARRRSAAPPWRAPWPPRRRGSSAAPRSRGHRAASQTRRRLRRPPARTPPHWPVTAW